MNETETEQVEFNFDLDRHWPWPWPMQWPTRIVHALLLPFLYKVFLTSPWLLKVALLLTLNLNLTRNQIFVFVLQWDHMGLSILWDHCHPMLVSYTLFIQVHFFSTSGVQYPFYLNCANQCLFFFSSLSASILKICSCSSPEAWLSLPTQNKSYLFTLWSGSADSCSSSAGVYL